MEYDRDADWAAIERVLAGDASPEDEQRVSRWECASDANARLMRELRSAWQVEAASGSRYDSHVAWSKLRMLMHAADDATESGHSAMHDAVSPQMESGHTASHHTSSQHAPTLARRPAPRRAPLLRWAAVVVLLAAGGAVLMREVPFMSAESALIAGNVSTAVGQRATVRLGDGSVVTLGPQSTLAEVQGSGRERRIELSGSAHFDVVRDESRPFVVVVGTAETRVLGTKFGVRGYGDETLEVVVESGRVSVRADASHEGVVLNPGQLGTVERDGRVSVRSNVDVARRLSWREGSISFDGTPLRVVAAELERWYGTEVRIADPRISEYPLTATFTGADIGDVLTVTSRSLGIQHSFDGRTAEFRQ